jgi:hypothetical protein
VAGISWLGSSGGRLVITGTAIFGRDTSVSSPRPGSVGPSPTGMPQAEDDYLGSLIWPADVELPGQAEPRPLDPPAPDDLALLLFTSGGAVPCRSRGASGATVITSRRASLPLRTLFDRRGGRKTGGG